MARRTNKKVDEFYHQKTNTRVEIFLTPDNEFETSEVFGTAFTRASAKEATSVMYAYLDELAKTSIYFEPIIEISRLSPFGQHGDNFIGIAAKRYWYGFNTVNLRHYAVYNWAMVQHKNFTGHEPEMLNYSDNFHDVPREKKDRVVFPYTHNSDTFLPYSEETWQGVQELITVIEKAKRRLDEILEAPDKGLSLFGNVGASLSNLLGPGEKND